MSKQIDRLIEKHGLSAEKARTICEDLFRPLLTTSEVAYFLSCHENMVRKLIYSGLLVHYKLGGASGNVRISYQAVEDYLEKQMVRSEQAVADAAKRTEEKDEPRQLSAKEKFAEMTAERREKR